MITTSTGAKKLESSDNWREIFPNPGTSAAGAHNASVDAQDRIQAEVAPIINGKRCSLGAASGDYVLLRNSTIAGKTDGAYQATKAIPANTDLDSTYLGSPITGGMVNELNNNLMKKTFTASSIADIVTNLPNSDDQALVCGATTISSSLGFSSGAINGYCRRVISSTADRIDFLFAQQNGKISVGNINCANNTVTHHLINIGSFETDTSVSGVTIKKAGNCVLVTFQKSTSSSQSGNVVIATIPSEYRPPINISTLDVSQHKPVQLNTSGNITIYGAVASTTYEGAFSYPVAL